MFGSLMPRGERSLFPSTDRFSRLLHQVEDEVKDLQEKFLGSNGGWLSEGKFSPTADLVETENAFEITLDLPGVKPEEVAVELKGGNLWITGKREEVKEEKDKTYHHVERLHGEFRRVLSLPSTIDEKKIEAAFDNGVLKITIAKAEEAKAKRIEIKG